MLVVCLGSVFNWRELTAAVPLFRQAWLRYSLLACGISVPTPLWHLSVSAAAPDSACFENGFPSMC